MGRGLGPLQRMILEELKQAPRGSLSVVQLACAIHGEPFTPAEYESTRRACAALLRRGLIWRVVHYWRSGEIDWEYTADDPNAEPEPLTEEEQEKLDQAVHDDAARAIYAGIFMEKARIHREDAGNGG